MGLASLIARRSLFRRPGRSLFSILGVALGVATVVGVVTLDHATIEGYARPRALADRPDIELQPAGGVESSSEALTSVQGISAASRFFQNEAVVRRERGAAGGGPTRVQLLAIEAEQAASFGLFGLLEGRDLEPGSGDVLIGPALADEDGFVVGDRLVLSRPARPAGRRCEDGVLVPVEAGVVDRPEERTFQVAGILTREGVGRSALGRVVVVDFDDAVPLYESMGSGARFWAVKDPTVDLERLQRSLASSYSYVLNRGVIVGQAADERAFRTGVRMLGLLALVLGLYVIFHTLSMSLTERVAEVGTLHALGSSRLQIARVFFSEAAALSGTGAALGGVLGVLLAWLATSAGITTLGVGKAVQQFHVPWNTVGSLALTGFLVALVGSVYPLMAIGGADTVAALRGMDALDGRSSRRFRWSFAALLGVLVPALYLVLVPVVGEATEELVVALLGVVGALALVVALSLMMPLALTALCGVIARPLAALFPFAGEAAARAMRDAPARVGVSASAIGLVAAGLVGLHGMTASLRGEVTTWAAEAVDDRIYVRALPPSPFEDLAEHLLRYPGVLGVESGAARRYAPFLVLGTDGASMSAYGPLAEDPKLLARFEEERSMFISRRLAQDLGYTVGDEVQMRADGGRVVTFEVAAVTDAYGYWTRPDERIYGVISDRWMERDFCVDPEVVTEVSVRFEPGDMTTDGHLGVLEAALADFHQGGASAELRLGRDVRNYALRDIDRDFIVFDLLLLLMAGLAALGVLNGMLLSTLERTREIGVFHALGASQRQIGGAMLLEAGVVGLVGGGLGVALGALATPWVVEALERIVGLSLQHQGAGAWGPIAFVGAIVTSLLAALYPIRRAQRIDAVRAVRTKS